MARKDNAPAPHTCPLIDTVINMIKTTTDEDFDIKEAINMMEQIRTANGELRDWGNELFNEKEELEDQISDLEGKLEDKQEDIGNLEDYIKTLEKQISES